MFDKLWWKGSHVYCQHFDFTFFSILKKCIQRIITNWKIVFSSKVMPIEWKGLGLLKKKKDWLIAFGPPNEGFNFSHWFNMRRYTSRDEMQNGLEQKNFSMPFYGASELSHTSSTYWKFTFLADRCEICGIPDFRNFVYKQDFYIVGFSWTNWPLMAHRFLWQRAISVLHIRCQDCQVFSKEINIFFSQYWIAKVLIKVWGKYNQLLTPGNKKPTLVDKLPRNGEWVDLNISSKSPCICWKQSTNKLYLAPALQENVATITICDVNRAVLRISRQYGILFLQPFSTSHSPVKWWFQENDWEMHG